MNELDWCHDYQAWLIAHHYNLAPDDPLKYERVSPTNGVASYFFANTSNTVRILIQYDVQKLEHPP